MASNPTLSNQKATWDANTNPDIIARTTETASGQLQHVRLDLGSGTTEAQETGSTGIFSSIYALLSRILSSLRSPEYMQIGANGKALRVLFNADSSLNTVSTVTAVTTVTTCGTVTNLTNFNTLESRELIWNGWKQNYVTAIRNRIT